MSSRKRLSNQIRKDQKEKENMTKSMNIVFKNEEQKEALEIIKNNTISFILGPAGTGKTHLAVCYAVYEFLKGNYDKIIMTRPAVDAGESIGFLPGTINDKIDPYMMPLLDLLNEKLDPRFVTQRFEEGLFEIAPLAFMRGRTLKNSIMILDEAQNATATQLKMFLTRIGEGSKIIVAGDESQYDRKNQCQLKNIAKGLTKIESIGFYYLSHSVRHPLIDKILNHFDSL